MSETARTIAALITIAVIFALIQLARYSDYRSKKRSRERAREIGSPETDTPGEYVDKLIAYHLKQERPTDGEEKNA